MQDDLSFKGLFYPLKSMQFQWFYKRMFAVSVYSKVCSIMKIGNGKS